MFLNNHLKKEWMFVSRKDTLFRCCLNYRTWDRTMSITPWKICSCLLKSSIGIRWIGHIMESMLFWSTGVILRLYTISLLNHRRKLKLKSVVPMKNLSDKTKSNDACWDMRVMERRKHNLKVLLLLMSDLKAAQRNYQRTQQIVIH